MLAQPLTVVTTLLMPLMIESTVLVIQFQVEPIQLKIP